MNIIQKLSSKKDQIAASVTALVVSAHSNAAVDAGSIVTKLEQNFTTAETVGIAIVGGFAVLFVFKLIQRML